MLKNIIILAIIFLVLKSLDIFTTLYVISLGGEEANPIADYFIQKSWATFIFVKIFVTLFVMGIFIFAVWKFPNELFRFSKISLIGLNVYYLIPVLWNTFGILVMRGIIIV